jgi:protocatechuate 3,4-dioxygenase beta subunit
MTDRDTARPGSTRTNLTRRDLLGFAAKGAASVMVSQVLVGCSSIANANTGDVVGDSGKPGSSASGCVLTAALTEGPFFVDEKLNRPDIRSDPASGAISAGIPLALTFNVSRIAGNACTPLTGAYIDVWHADASGTYSDVSGMGNSSSAAGRKFLRGYQVTDASGIARFTTIYPGWYNGRAVHIHFKLRMYAGATQTYEFTSQFFMPESLTSVVHAQAPYASRGTRTTFNSTDGIYNSLTTAQKSALTLDAAATSEGYAGTINLDVSVG